MSDIESLIMTIKDLWPQIHIKKADMLHPNFDFVTRFYSNFLADFKEKVHVLAGSYFYQDENNEYVETESDRLFQSMYSIFSQLKIITFVLSDIYDPGLVRTKNVFKICCHLIPFTESILEECENLSKNILKMKENSTIMENKIEQILLDIEGNTARKSELLNQKEEALQELQTQKQLFQDAEEQYQQKEKECISMERKIEKLKFQYQDEQQQLDALVSKENNLVEKCVTEDEYQSLLRIVDNLKKESEALDDSQTNIDDFLRKENDTHQHYLNCLNMLPNVADFPLDLVKNSTSLLEELRKIQLKNKEFDIQKTNSEQLLRDKKEELLVYKQRSDQLSNELQTLSEKFSLEHDEKERDVAKRDHDLKESLRLTNKAKRECMEDIERTEQEFKNLKDTFYSEYVKVTQAEAAAKQHFKNFMLKLNNNK